jgi:3-oxoacyl-[acyl-carrier protein] reductase
VSSNTVLLGKRNLVHYISAKAGVIGLTRALARELGEFGVCVNCVIPGAILVQHEIELYPDQEAATQRLIERQCIKRRGTPKDLTGLFVFLASTESDFITGQAINVDGGWAFY